MYSYHTRVAPSQVYADGHMTPTSLICLMQDCSQFWLESEPDLVAWLRQENVLMIIASRQMDILRYPAMGEHLTTTTSIYGLRSALGYRNTFIFDESGAPVAKSWAVGAFVSAQTGTLMPLPQHLIDTYTHDEKREMDYAPRKIKLPKPAAVTAAANTTADNATATTTEHGSNQLTSTAASVAPAADTTTVVTTEPLYPPAVRATRADIDFNKHVNNAQYVRIAWEYTPRDFSCKRVRVEYKEQAPEGCLIMPVVYQEPDRIVVLLNNAQEKPYAIVEFS